MKANFIKIYALLIVACSTSCKKDFLQFDLGTALPEEKVFADPLLASRYADNAYNFMIDEYGRLNDTYKGTTGMFSDEATGSVSSVLAMGSGNFQACSDVTTIYPRMYQGIRIINTTLSKLDIVPWTSDYNPGLIRAQMLFLRGMFYFELVKRFGDAVIVPSALGPLDNTDLPRSPYAEVVSYILGDLQESETLLAAESSPNYSPADEWDAGNYGRVTVGAVKALKARLLLLDASPLHNPGGDAAKWNIAAAAAKDIIDMNKYALHADYSTLLNVNTSPEYIMIKVRPPRALAGMMNDFIMSKGSGGAQGNLNPTQNHVDLYEAVIRAGNEATDPIISSSPIGETGSGYDPQKPYNNRDPRFYSNIVYNDMDWQGRKIVMYINETPPAGQVPDYGTTAIYTKTRYYCKKLWPEVYKQGSTSTALVNYIMFRYGEVLLNYAEALNEAAGPVSDVYKYVNEIRARVGMPGLPAGLTKDQMRERIHNERGVELAFEELRWWDILRWKKGPELVSRTLTAMDVEKTPTGFNYNVVPVDAAFQRAPFEDFMYYYPIPRSEINKSNNILKQNAGWN
ncbi:RagB/SusD family nutrient uptake outer membrane protein [Chitinophaga barathri]|uniref:RagB/SusD family nutrient uptake outer membrane protein n=1 Tax=Chitinophaga barathri TaxID=1647451 RepID=A0A3N4N5U8_9BACT|nr:RagB/SusD family nutrient uptake outer membrane protein [Chitinophaga barathri]RPD43013.1 RagB/SusD family nutrient uptake outer membrane protein [Chitinophaga barathri]